MSDRILVSTRKGLITLARGSNGWSVAGMAFDGVPVTAALADARDGALYAALKHGHFGPKLHRSQDGGNTWTEIATPAFPPDTPDAPSLKQMFTIEPAAQTAPAGSGLGRCPRESSASTIAGKLAARACPLWDVQGRSKWMGGGNEDTAMHTVSPDPRDPDRAC